MCARYTLRTPAKDQADFFGVWLDAAVDRPRWNIAPSSPVLTVRRDENSATRTAAMMRWGLIPSWAKDAKAAGMLVNARAETAATKPAFRAAFRRRRCLIPADGYYEWKAIPGQKPKQPYLYTLAHDALFGFAGLWETWHAPDGEIVESCTILTTTPNPLAAQVHDRMPVILPRSDHNRWLDPQTPVDDLTALLAPFPADAMRVQAVNPAINRAGVNVDPRYPPDETPPPAGGLLFDV